MTAPALEELAVQAREMYTLPAVALEVLGLTSNPLSDGPKLKTAISRDPALATRVLRVVNSSLFGLSHPVSDLQQAVTLLGTKSLRLLVLGFSLPPALTMHVAADVLNQYWKHALTKAIAAREIALRSGAELADEAFLAGLLADLGMLVLIQELGQPYVQLVGRVRESHRDLGPAELHALGFDHVQLTARLMKQWGFPPALIEAVAASGVDEGDAFVERPPLAKILRLSELMTRLLAEDQAEVLPAALLAARRDHGLSEPQFTALAQSLDIKVRRLADVLALTLPAGLEYSQVLERARSELLDASAVAAVDLSAAHRSRTDEAAELDTWQEIRELNRVVRRVTHPGENAVAPPKTEQVRRQQATAVSDNPLIAALHPIVTSCRDHRRSLSLLLVAADRGPTVIDPQDEYGRWLEQVSDVCQHVDAAAAQCLRLNALHWAIVLPECDRSQVVELGHDVLRQVRALGFQHEEHACTVSLGAATVPLPPRNFTATKLAESANRCLGAAQMSGGNTLKSLEIY